MSPAEKVQREAALAHAKAGGTRAFSGRGTGIVSIFVLGPSRSGKTTLEALLSGLKAVKRGYENPFVDRAVSRTSQEAGLFTHARAVLLPPGLDESFRKHYNTELENRASGAAAFTNTHPGWISDATRLAEALPDVRFVFVKRDLDDITLRIFMQHYKRGNDYAYEIGSVRDYVRWYNDMIDAIAARFPAISTVIRYEEMVKDPAATLRTVAGSCGLDTTGNVLPPIGDDRECSKPYRVLWDAPAAAAS